MKNEQYMLKLVLTDHWFDEIKSGRKIHEYREVKPFWVSRIYGCSKAYAEERIKRLNKEYDLVTTGNEYVEFQKAYRKNAEKMIFKIKKMSIRNGKYTDLHIDKWVFDIELGEKIR